MPQVLKEYNFTYDNIKCISDKQFNVHVELYKGYITKINEITLKLHEPGVTADANATYSKYRGLKLGETYSLDGVILHELYFANLGGTHKEPYGQALELINLQYGSYDAWKEDFIACGKAARGWAVFAHDQRSKSFRNFACDAHDIGAIWTAYPLIVMDVYEHAYFVDYANKKADYIKNFMEDIDWDVVNKRAGVIRV